MSNAISAVGTIATADATGLTTLSVAPTAVGNCLALGAVTHSTSLSVASVTGGGVTTWVRILSAFVATVAGDTLDLWLGPVAVAGASTITITGSGSLSSARVALTAQELAGGGSGTVWALDGAQSGGLGNTSSTNVTFPTLTPGDVNSCYIGYSALANTGLSSGQTSGYVLQLDGHNNPFIYNVSISGVQSPVAVQNSAGTSGTSGALIVASSPGGGVAPPYPGLLVSRLRPYFG
jgi:hypothetical protein